MAKGLITDRRLEERTANALAFAPVEIAKEQSPPDAGGKVGSAAWQHGGNPPSDMSIDPGLIYLVGRCEAWLRAGDVDRARAPKASRLAGVVFVGLDPAADAQRKGFE
jgi:hypothetical protein